MLHVPTDLARHAIEIRGQPSPIHWSLADIRDVIRWRRNLILTIMACVVAAAVVYVAVAPPMYTATAVLMTDTKRAPAYGTAGTPDTSVDMVVVESQNETLKSDKIALAVIDKLKLWEDPEFVPAGPTLWGYIMGLFSTPGSKSKTKTADIKRQIAVGNFKKALNVERAGRSYVSEIDFKSTDPEKSATIANAVAEAYIVDQLSSRLQIAQRSSDWVESRVGELQKRASAAAKELADFKAANGLTGTSTSGSASGTPPQSELGQRLRELETAAQSARTTYETFLNRYTQSIQIQQQAFPVTEARVLAEAMPPLSKSAPKTSIILLLAVVGGATLGVIAAFAREYEQRLVRAPRQIERELRVRVLGALPKVKRPLLFRRGPLHLTHAPKPSLPYYGKAVPIALAGESLRGIKVALERNGADQYGVIGVTSPRAGTGKTTLAYNLASLSAQCGRRTLLIDGDLRRQALTRALAPRHKLGLVSLMAGSAEMAECIVEHRSSFYFLAGTVGPEAAAHPSELLASAAMTATMEGLKKTFDTVIIDLPPVLDCVDVRASAHTIGIFILVTEWGRTSVEDLDRALASSDIIVERLLGVTINKVAAAEFGRQH